MRGFEEIQKIVKNFVEESGQAKQQIIDIENERNNLAQERNEKKEANIQENLAKINELGKQISKLGNQSQELQNKLDKRFFEVKKLVNLMIDNKITEEMRKIRKINEVKEEYMEKIALKEERNAKYEIQKQEFFEIILSSFAEFSSFISSKGSTSNSSIEISSIGWNSSTSTSCIGSISSISISSTNGNSTISSSFSFLSQIIFAQSLFATAFLNSTSSAKFSWHFSICICFSSAFSLYFSHCLS